MYIGFQSAQKSGSADRIADGIQQSVFLVFVVVNPGYGEDAIYIPAISVGQNLFGQAGVFAGTIKVVSCGIVNDNAQGKRIIVC